MNWKAKLRDWLADDEDNLNDEDDVVQDCAHGVHDPAPVMASTSRVPLGYRCSECGARCDAKGKASP